MNRFNDIEDFTTDELRKEIIKRELLDSAGTCWYCKANLAAHTCKYAEPSPVPGWHVEPAVYLTGEDCMGRPEAYWRCTARNPVTGKIIMGTGGTADEATAAAIKNVQRRLDPTIIAMGKTWNRAPRTNSPSPATGSSSS